MNYGLYSPSGILLSPAEELDKLAMLLEEHAIAEHPYHVEDPAHLVTKFVHHEKAGERFYPDYVATVWIGGFYRKIEVPELIQKLATNIH